MMIQSSVGVRTVVQRNLRILVAGTATIADWGYGTPACGTPACGTPGCGTRNRDIKSPSGNPST